MCVLVGEGKGGVATLAHLGILLIVMLLCAYPASDHVVLDRVGQRKVIIAQRGHIAILDKGVVQVTIEVLLHFGYVANLRDAAHRNLLPAIRVRLWLRHFAPSTLCC